jgi:hypothetical protein
MVMVSLILALTVTQALRGLSEIVISEKRYWPHTLWVAMYALLVIQSWWAYWDYTVIEEWQFTTYLWVLLNPIILFASVHFLVPAARSSDIDWRERLYSVRRWQCGLGVVLVTSGVITNVIYLSSPWLHPYRIFQAIVLASFLIGLLTSNERIHKALPVIAISALITSQLLIRLNIGAMIAD